MWQHRGNLSESPLHPRVELRVRGIDHSGSSKRHTSVWLMCLGGLLCIDGTGSLATLSWSLSACRIPRMRGHMASFFHSFGFGPKVSDPILKVKAIDVPSGSYFLLATSPLGDLQLYYGICRCTWIHKLPFAHFVSSCFGHLAANQEVLFFSLGQSTQQVR